MSNKHTGSHPHGHQSGRPRFSISASYDFADMPEGQRIAEGESYLYNGLRIVSLVGETTVVAGHVAGHELETNNPVVDPRAPLIAFRPEERPVAVVFTGWIPAPGKISFSIWSNRDQSDGIVREVEHEGGVIFFTESLPNGAPIETIELSLMQGLWRWIRTSSLTLINTAS